MKKGNFDAFFREKCLTKNSMNAKGDAYTGWMDNGVGAVSAFLDKDWPGLPPVPTEVVINAKDPSTFLPNTTIQAFGYGMIAIKGTEVGVTDGSTHTWDSSTFPTIEGEPPLPPPTETDPSKLVYTIIKSYRLKNNGTLTHVTTTWRTQTVASIVIEDEPLNTTDKNYKVIGWKQSSSANFGITATNWNPPGIIGQTGTSKGTTTLDTSHKILYQCEPSLTV